LTYEDNPPKSTILCCSGYGELGCGFLTLEVAPFLHVPEASSGQAKMEQLLMKKYLQPNSLM